jgi:predicted DNA-binding transcriptional regulator AlpA
MRGRMTYKARREPELSRDEVLKLLRLRDSEFTDLTRRADFPRAVYVGELPRWYRDEVIDWLEGQKFMRRFATRY